MVHVCHRFHSCTWWQQQCLWVCMAVPVHRVLMAGVSQAEQNNVQNDNHTRDREEFGMHSNTISSVWF